MQAEKTISLFTKDSENPNNIFDMQCMWFELAYAHSCLRHKEVCFQLHSVVPPYRLGHCGASASPLYSLVPGCSARAQALLCSATWARNTDYAVMISLYLETFRGYTQ